ncbi:RING finger domain-containing protein [Agarilytica rhodophyticola]|uniref:RING finger domain-containing protein n=1 Tax=Agarilytica rhodophyticola TaxID=1737490 RepID=UPI001315A1E1|nr:RING finger protein [Agarilytica rhodophyticola]
MTFAIIKNKDCPICLQPIKKNERVTMLRCRNAHAIHPHCAHTLLRTNHPKCPLDKKSIAGQNARSTHTVIKAPTNSRPGQAQAVRRASGSASLNPPQNLHLSNSFPPYRLK